MADTDDYQRNPEELNGVEDLSLLIFLEMGNVLDNLHHRYKKMKTKEIYTSLSNILVAVNPYETLPIYGEEMIQNFLHQIRAGRPLTPPHPYAVGARANTRMLQREGNQSVIVCGESGAGKTETTKLVIRYLAQTTPSNLSNASNGAIEMQIMCASPILEAFGNAKTILNNNSSRFGKFTKLLYSMGGREHARGEIVGSTLETYLLEKSRVVFQAKNERNYHSFYFVNAGLDDAQRKEWEITSLDDFWYTNQGQAATVPGISDSARFEEMADSLKVMRIDGTEQHSIWMLTMGIMHLGNVNFKKDSQDFAILDPKTKSHLEMAAKLFNVSADALEARLTTTTMKVGRKSITKKIQFQNATANRDSISKGSYENLFLYLAGRINQELCNLDEDIDKFLFIGVLDVFGFENFKKNSLEQFCINFTNEKLQEFFNYHIIAAEQEEYLKESVVWTEIEVPSSKEIISLVEQKHKGFFAVLDSACQAPKPDVEAFYQEFFKNHAKHPKVDKHIKRKVRGYFGAEFQHFADRVKYDLREFIPKNMEKLHVDTKKMFNTSGNALIKQVAGGKTKKRRGFTSVTSVFSRALSTLMTNLRDTEPYFVRCVNPNKKKSGKIYDRKVVRDQLRCGGIIEALRVLKLGYPTRVSYEIIYNKYHPTINNPLLKRMPPEKFSAAILIAFGVGEEDYELGLTKIFFRPAKAAILDEIMAQADELSDEQSKRVLDWLAVRRRNQIMGMLKIASYYSNKIRDLRAITRWNDAGRKAGHISFTLFRYLQAAREIIEERNRNKAATVIRAYWKAYYVRQAIEKKKKRTQKAVRKLWRAHKTYTRRQAVMKWLDGAVEETRIRLERERKEREERERREREERERIEREMAEAERKRLSEMQEERRREEMERLEKERLAREEQKRKEREEADRKAKEEAERLAREEEERKLKEQKQAEENRLRVEAEARKQRQKSVQANKAEAEKRRQTRRTQRNKKLEDIETEVDTQYDDQEEERIRKRNQNLKNIHVNQAPMPGYDDDASSSDENEYEDIFGKEATQDFTRVAANGMLFMKHTGRKKNRAPQDRFVKVTFTDDSQPQRVSWGSGSRHMDFKDIRLIAWGHYSPAFVARSDELDPRTCFSIVSQTSILDLQNADIHVVEQWVRGLRELLGQSDEDAAQLSRELKENPPRQKHRPGRDRRQRRGDGSDRPRRESRRPERENRDRRRRKSTKQKTPTDEHKKRTKSLMLLQQDLFVMTTTTVFRNLEEENYPITQRLKDSFNPKQMYEKALQNDVPWRQWQNWIHEQIVNKMVAEGTIEAPGVGASSHGGKEGSEAQMADMMQDLQTRERGSTNADCVIS